MLIDIVVFDGLDEMDAWGPAVCTGTMLLAHAGLVGVRRASTHHTAWSDLEATRRDARARPCGGRRRSRHKWWVHERHRPRAVAAAQGVLRRPGSGSRGPDEVPDGRPDRPGVGAATGIREAFGTSGRAKCPHSQSASVCVCSTGTGLADKVGSMTIATSTDAPETFSARSCTFRVLDDGASTAGRLGVVALVLVPGWGDPPQHVHCEHDETSSYCKGRSGSPRAPTPCSPPRDNS